MAQAVFESTAAALNYSPNGWPSRPPHATAMPDTNNWQSAVSPNGIRPRLGSCSQVRAAEALRIANPRHSRLPVCATMLRDAEHVPAGKRALVCPAGAGSIGMRVPDGADDGNRSRTARSEPQGTERKGRRQTLDCRNTNRQRGRVWRASRLAQAKPNSHQTGLCRA